MTVGFDLHAPPVTPRDAASVILVRDGAQGVELFFVKRRADVRFMGGAFVFPGGKLDPEDDSPSIATDLDDAQCRARMGEPDNALSRALHIAAARECLEESGVLLSTAPVAHDRIARARHALDVEKRPLTEVLAELDATLALRELIPFARWVTPREETRRFDARFFIARADARTQASHDTRETVASAWLSPAEAIARAERREIVLVPPTYRTAQLLATARTADEAIALAQPSGHAWQPVVRALESSFEILLPDDHDHPEHARFVSAQTPSFVTRFVYDDGVWSSVRAPR